MSGSYAGPARLGLVPDEPDQVARLLEFRAAHPDVIIGSGGFGTWQARIPEENGETVTTRYTLRELLDKLDELTTGRGGGPAAVKRHGTPVSAWKAPGERGQPVRAGQLVVAEHADGPAGLLQAVPGQLVGAVDGPGQPFVGRVGQREQPGALELEQQPGQRMREDVVHVTGQPLAFGQRGGAQFGAAGLLQLDQQPLGLRLLQPDTPAEQHDHVDRRQRKRVDQQLQRALVTPVLVDGFGHQQEGQTRGEQHDAGPSGDDAGGDADRDQQPDRPGPVGLQPHQNRGAHHEQRQHRYQEPHGHPVHGERGETAERGQGEARQGQVHAERGAVHPAIRIAIGLVVLIAGVTLHKVIFDVAGAVVMIAGAAQWLHKARR